jgi:hypothetical protein
MQTQDRHRVENVTGAPTAHPSAPLMRTRGEQGIENGGGETRSPKMVRVAVVLFLLSSVFQLAFGRWVSALLQAATVCLFTAKGGIESWPKPARYLFIIIYAALAVATVFEVLYQTKVLR